MIRIGFATNASDSQLRYMAQMGATDVVTVLPAEHRRPVWPLEPMLALKQRVESFGLRLSVFEGIPISDRIKLGLPGRDEDLENFLESLRNMGRAGIPLLCYNWMAAFNWLRTSFATPVRGGALATAYVHQEMERQPPNPYGEIHPDQLWETLTYFLQATVPVAEEFNVKLAMHPDDPPLSPVRGMARIMTSPEEFQRLLDLRPSPVNGMTFCQGCFSEMGVDVPATIRHFGRQGKIFFAHFRDVIGRADNFVEAFHDAGQTDMYAAMKAYYEVGFDGPMRPDHAPTMEGESNDNPGYALQGRLFAVGYMRGLMHAIERQMAAG